MKVKLKFIFPILLLSPVLLVQGQMNNFRYKREIAGINKPWHQIIIPDEMYAKVKSDFSDIRIYGINASNDTTEAPFLLEVENTFMEELRVPFKIINQVYAKGVYWYTFESTSKENINEIKLHFENDNFDWKVNLEASLDGLNWSTITEEYRILSIHNSKTNYEFTNIYFSESAFHYYRLSIKSIINPKLSSAYLSNQISKQGNYKYYNNYISNRVENKSEKQSITFIDFKQVLPISGLQIAVKNKIDFYRPIEIQCLVDSFETPKGWQYVYSNLYQGVISSFEQGDFHFKTQLTRQLKLIINNDDNELLTFNKIEPYGAMHKLIIRFSNTDAQYFLVYGNSNALFPEYDLKQFPDKIPHGLSTLLTGNEIMFKDKIIEIEKPLFNNVKGLWILMSVIILILGWFTFRMLKSTK